MQTSKPGEQASWKRVEAWLNNKLGNAEWPIAPSIIDHLPIALKLWEAGDLDAMVKVRLCICCAMMNRVRREDSAMLLGELGVAARSDPDEWVKVIGCAVGNFNGTMDFKAVRESSQAVDESFSSVWSLLEGPGSDQEDNITSSFEGFLPLEDQYMHPELREPQKAREKTTDQAHFAPREAAITTLDFSLESLMLSGQLQGLGKKVAKQAVASTANRPNTNIFIPNHISRAGRQPSVDNSAGTPRGIDREGSIANKRPRVDGPEGGDKALDNTEII